MQRKSTLRRRSSYTSYTECPKIIVFRVSYYYGGAVDSMISIFKQLQRPGVDLEFATLFESIWNVVADLWHRKSKMSCRFITSASIVLQQCQNKGNFQWKDSGIVSKFPPHLLKDRECSLINRQNCQPLKLISIRIYHDIRTITLETDLILTLLENNRGAIFEATTYFAFSPP